MPKRRSGWPDVGRKAKRQRQRRHVYFVIDDGHGYAIRKVDLSSDYDSDDDAAHHEDGTIEMMTGVASPLPRPLIRLAALTGEFFTASGTKILVTRCNGWPKRAVPAFDVRTRSLTSGPRPPRCPMTPLYMPVGRRAVSLDNGSFTEFLDPPAPEHKRFEWAWEWEELAKAPFRRHDVTCHAAHPDGRTLFVSAESKGGEATFSLDTTAEAGSAWKKHVEWTLPFQGHAHFDPALNAWVGLSEAKEYLGYLSSCDVVPIDTVASSDVQAQPMVSANSDVVSVDHGDAGRKVQPTGCDGKSSDDDSSSSGDLPPRWTLGKDKMFCEDPAEEHHGAVLVYMGGRSKYCLLQCFSVIDVDAMDSDDEDDPYKEDVREEDLPRRHLLRLTTFTLKYDKNGELTTAKRRRVRCYELPSHLDPLYNDFRAFLI